MNKKLKLNQLVCLSLKKQLRGAINHPKKFAEKVHKPSVFNTATQKIMVELHHKGFVISSRLKGN